MTESTALVPAGTATQVALLRDLAEDAKAFADSARSANTIKAYASRLREFEVWCGDHGVAPYPTTPDVVTAHITWLAKKGRATATISQTLSAIRAQNPQTQDRANPVDHPVVAEVWRGIRREIAKTRARKKAPPLLQAHLTEILDFLSLEAAGELRKLRDSAMLALGWAGARRRSEIAGLDWHQLGAGTGFVTLDEIGATITLMVSKTSQETAQTYVIPRAAQGRAVTLLQDWAARAGLAPGAALFQGILKGDKLRGTHLTDRQVSNCVKARVKQASKAQLTGRKRLSKEQKEQIAAFAEGFSGHSLRAGFMTSAADAGVPVDEMMQQSGHKSTDVAMGYVRNADKHRKNALNKMGAI